MAHVIVTALKPLEYRGRSHVRGDKFEAVPVEALALQRTGHVTLTTGAMVEPPVVKPAPRARRSYRRKDIVAESPE